MSPELQSQIGVWRAQEAAGEMTLEEYRKVILHLRGDRTAAQQASAVSKSRAKKPANLPDADSMLDELV